MSRGESTSTLCMRAAAAVDELADRADELQDDLDLANGRIAELVAELEDARKEGA